MGSTSSMLCSQGSKYCRSNCLTSGLAVWRRWVISETQKQHHALDLKTQIIADKVIVIIKSFLYKKTTIYFYLYDASITWEHGHGELGVKVGQLFGKMKLWTRISCCQQCVQSTSSFITLRWKIKKQTVKNKRELKIRWYDYSWESLNNKTCCNILTSNAH